MSSFQREARQQVERGWWRRRRWRARSCRGRGWGCAIGRHVRGRFCPRSASTRPRCRSARCVARRFCEKRISFSDSYFQLFHSYSHSHSHSLPSWVPRGAPTSENAPSHGHKTYRDRDLRREEHLSEPTHTLGRHRAREWQPVHSLVSCWQGKPRRDRAISPRQGA